jgi:hypothetical protein
MDGGKKSEKEKTGWSERRIQITERAMEGNRTASNERWTRAQAKLWDRLEGRSVEVSAHTTWNSI